MAHDIPMRDSVGLARQLIGDAIAHLDEAHAPADIAAHLDFALFRIDELSSISGNQRAHFG